MSKVRVFDEEDGSISLVPIDELESVCAWQDCSTSFKGPQLPPGWTWLVTWWSPFADPDVEIRSIIKSRSCTRDTALCPEHARQLEALLAPIPSRALDAPVGKA
jgi:hypothetical protein